MSALVDPTAASAWLPENLPTTIISTALNISCKIPDSMSGSEKEINLSIIVPLHISISYLFFFAVVCSISVTAPVLCLICFIHCPFYLFLNPVKVPAGNRKT